MLYVFWGYQSENEIDNIRIEAKRRAIEKSQIELWRFRDGQMSEDEEKRKEKRGSREQGREHGRRKKNRDKSTRILTIYQLYKNFLV